MGSSRSSSSARLAKAAISCTFWRLPFDSARTRLAVSSRKRSTSTPSVGDVGAAAQAREELERLLARERGPQERLSRHVGHLAVRRERVGPGVHAEQLGARRRSGGAARAAGGSSSSCRRRSARGSRRPRRARSRGRARRGPACRRSAWSARACAPPARSPRSAARSRRGADGRIVSCTGRQRSRTAAAWRHPGLSRTRRRRAPAGAAGRRATRGSADHARRIRALPPCAQELPRWSAQPRGPYVASMASHLHLAPIPRALG